MSLNSQNKVIAFIGLGVMGRSMAGHLLQAGFRVQVHTRTKQKAEELVRRKALWHDSPGAAARNAQVIFTMVGYPSEVETVYFGSDGILENATPGALLIDMSTSQPSLARRISEAAQRLGLAALDAPVSGGDVGAREARLSIMVGGSKEDFKNAHPLFELLGKNIVWQGEAGSGQHAKMCNQIAVAGTLVGACEALAYAKKAGLNPETVLQSISAGAAGSWTLSNLAPRILAGDFEPGFFVRHFLKDLDIALQEAKSMELELPGLDLAQRLYDRLMKEGHGFLGTQALYFLYGHTSN